jgi:tetratricopeptide (TPR) repeat protein
LIHLLFLFPVVLHLFLFLPGTSREGWEARAWGEEKDPPRAGRAEVSPDVEKQMDLIRARILSRQGLLEDSLDLYRDLRERFPADQEIWIDYIETLVNAELFEASEAELNAFLAQYPENLRALRIQARVFYEQGRFAFAYPVYDHLVEVFSGDAGVWSDYGYARQGGGDWAGALNCFSRVLELDPENEDALRSVHTILREHRPRLDTGYRLYRQEDGDAEWGTWYLRAGRHLGEKSWWTFAYDRVTMDRPAQPFLPPVNETLHDASLRVDYTFNRFIAAHVGAGLYSGMGDGAGFSVGLDARPDPSLALRADYTWGRPWFDPMEAVDQEGRENRLLLSMEWTRWSPWTLYMEAEQSDYETRDLDDYGRRRGILGILSRRFGDNPALTLSYSYLRRRFEYGSETFRPVLMIEREGVHELSALFEHRLCTYWTVRMQGGVRKDHLRDLDSWFILPELNVRMGNRLEGRVSYEHSSEAGTVAGGISRTFHVGLRVIF